MGRVGPETYGLYLSEFLFRHYFVGKDDATGNWKDCAFWSMIDILTTFAHGEIDVPGEFFVVKEDIAAQFAALKNEFDRAPVYEAPPIHANPAHLIPHVAASATPVKKEEDAPDCPYDEMLPRPGFAAAVSPSQLVNEIIAEAIEEPILEEKIEQEVERKIETNSVPATPPADGLPTRTLADIDRDIQRLLGHAFEGSNANNDEKKQDTVAEAVPCRKRKASINYAQPSKKMRAMSRVQIAQRLMCTRANSSLKAQYFVFEESMPHSLPHGTLIDTTNVFCTQGHTMVRVNDEHLQHQCDVCDMVISVREIFYKCETCKVKKMGNYEKCLPCSL